MPSGMLAGIVVLAALYNSAVTIMIYADLKKRGEPVSFFWLRMMAPSYVNRYRRLTAAESGHAGPLFRHWAGSAWISLAGVALLILSRV